MGLSLFVLILLSLSVLFFRHASSVESRHIELSFAQKIYDSESSIKGVLAEAIEKESNISAAEKGSSLIFSEHLPSSFSRQDELLSMLKQEIERDFYFVSIGLDEYLNSHAVIAQPLNLAYEHNGSSAIHIPANSNITGYNINLTVNRNITSCTHTTESGGSVDFYLTVRSPSSNCIVSEDNALTSTANVTFEGGEANFRLAYGGELDIVTSVEAESAVAVNFTGINGNIYFEAPIKININDSQAGFSKKSSVELPLLSWN